MPVNRGGSAAAPFVLALLVPSLAAAAEPSKQECVAANEAAQDLRRVAQLREARTQLARCVSISCPGPVREDCAQRLSEVDAAMPTLVLVAKDTHGNDLSAVSVTMDGQPFAETLAGRALQVDPGEHRFVFEGAGLPPAEKVIVVREGDKNRQVAVVLRRELAEANPANGTAAEDAPDDGSRRVVAFGLGGGGIAGLVAGTTLGLMAKSTYDHALQIECSGPKACTQMGVDDGRSARSLASGSTVAFVVGGLLLAGGVAVYLTAPKAGSVSMSPAVGTHAAGLRIRAVW